MTIIFCHIGGDKIDLKMEKIGGKILAGNFVLFCHFDLKNLNQNKMNESNYECKNCETTDITKFSPKCMDICKDCKRKLKNKTYECKICGETDIEKFTTGRYGKCKRCRNKSDTKTTESKKSEDVFYESYSDNKHIYKSIENYIKFNYDIFEEFTIKQYIEYIVKDNINKEIRIKNLETQLLGIKEILNAKESKY